MKAVADTLAVARSNLIERVSRRAKSRRPYRKAGDGGSFDDIFVSLDRLQAAFQHSSTPVEQQAGSDARSPRHIGHRHPGLHRLPDQPDLLGGRPTATPLD